jgi:hypothetical protein
MTAPGFGEHGRPGGRRLPRALQSSEVRVALVIAVCLLVEAIVAKNVLDVTLDPLVQLAPIWVFLAYTWQERRDRVAELATMATAVVATAGILVVSAL